MNTTNQLYREVLIFKYKIMKIEKKDIIVLLTNHSLYGINRRF
jgi:hypothetical protein